MIWIVGVWHLQQYANYDIVNHITEDITSGVLGAFIFISGYFLGKKSINSLSELGDFYKRRFLRIYPMFFLSCISLYLLYVLFNTDSITSVKELILTLTGLACIIPPIPSTIWFVCMILLFYAITPLIISRKSVASRIAVCVAIYAVLISIKLIFKDTDHRLLLWFPMYSLGLLLANVKFKVKCNWVYSIVGVAGFVGMSFVKDRFVSSDLLKGVADFVIAGLFVIAVMELCKLLENLPYINKLLLPVSYASMCAYLFHRQYYGVCKMFYNAFPIWFGVLVALPSLLVIAYFAQLLYDKLIDVIIKK